jgi:ssRNA-specific RNase YbeY (16S rRNA maturation enzyme)
MYKKITKNLKIYSNNKRLLNLVYKILIFFKDNYLELYQKIENKAIYIENLPISRIKELKKQYFGIYVSTDTVTLVYEDSVFIFICLNIIYNNSRKYKISYKEEIFRVLIHSLLHAINFKESDEMFNLQEEILNKLKKSNKL